MDPDAIGAEGVDDDEDDDPAGIEPVGRRPACEAERDEGREGRSESRSDGSPHA